MRRGKDPSILILCYSKLEGVFIRIFDLIRLIPLRLQRIIWHFGHLFVSVWKRPKRLLDFQENLAWSVELLCYLLDLIGVGEVYETICDFVKFNSRPLHRNEIDAVQQIFGKSFPTRRIRLDEYAFLGPRTHHFAYVSFCTINHWGALSPELFIHEMVHVWQYHKLGSVYIPRALRAQFSEEGYNYGGLANLVLAIRSGRGIRHFNLEQQGDILADYSRIRQGKNPRWGGVTSDDLWVYEHIVEDMKEAAV
ncbi:MAG: hypothetical protein OEQ53_09430 [Saprospiraceae bacterium]|nr:hypothetical protein [Saprospiraceae bacterium]